MDARVWEIFCVQYPNCLLQRQKRLVIILILVILVQEVYAPDLEWTEVNYCTLTTHGCGGRLDLN